MGGTIKRKNKEWVANHVEFNHPKYRGSKDKRADQEDALVFGLSIRYPELRQSNIVPVFGRLYKVDIVVLKRTDRKHVINFTWIGHNLGNLDHALSEYSFQVPLNSGVGCITTVRGHSLRLTQIESLKDKPGEFVASFKNDQRYEAKHAPTRVRVDDLLMIRERGHRVLAVVPRDGKTGVIGWVEFDPEPLTVAAIKDKGWGDRIVWPEK